MDEPINTILHGDCIAGMNALGEGSVDLVFADPPFNIGYDYDEYDDSKEHEHYLDWSRQWIAAVHRAIKETGTFWLAIGDEYAAELKLASQDVGFHCRSWVIWYYTFGVNCTNKFSRSHAHLFHFVKNPKEFTFRCDDLENRIPSARQLVYNDKRANPKGRLPDDTWIIRPADVVGELTADDGTWSPADLGPPSDQEQTWTLRPQDLDTCFKASEDTWYFPRVAGTFKERAGFHGCQMPEQLLGRIIRACSHEGELVLDPFSGSATTLAVAKKLGRQYLGFDVSSEYIKHGQSRLLSIHVGDRLDGFVEPLMSAPKTGVQHKKETARIHAQPSNARNKGSTAQAKRYEEHELLFALDGVAEAFRLTHKGFSADRVVADPDLNESYGKACQRLGLAGDRRIWNFLLFKMRKAGKLSHIPTTQRTSFSWKECDDYLFASEIALQMMLDDQLAVSLDEILCDPSLAVQFDKRARRFAFGYSSLKYRWAALKLRKQARLARNHSSSLVPPRRLSNKQPLDELDVNALPSTSGVYLLRTSRNANPLYVGEALNLQKRFLGSRRNVWARISNDIVFQRCLDIRPAVMLAWQCIFAHKYKPRMNYYDLYA